MDHLKEIRKASMALEKVAKEMGKLIPKVGEARKALDIMRGVSKAAFNICLSIKQDQGLQKKYLTKKEFNKRICSHR